MDQPLDEWEAEYDRLSKALEPYRRRIHQKFFTVQPVQVTDAEKRIADLDGFCAMLANSFDIFGSVYYIIENKAAFVEIGATGVLKALDALMPFYLEQQKLSSEEEKRRFWRETRDERASAENLSEGMNQFAELLLAYAVKHLSIGE